MFSVALEWWILHIGWNPLLASRPRLFLPSSCEKIEDSRILEIHSLIVLKKYFNKQ